MARVACTIMALCAFLASATAAAAQQVVPLWPGTAPGSEGRTGSETVRLTPQGDHIVSHVTEPTLTLYLPSRPAATGAGVLVIPGGGHRELWLDHEGYRVGEWLRQHGIAAFVLKYRLAREEGSTYTVEGTELADVQRALRLIRSRAAEWRLAPERLGVIGFSAGGELAALAGTRYDPGKPDAADAVDRQSSRPAFMALMYPVVPGDMRLTKDAPPAFLMVGESDQLSRGVVPLCQQLEQAGVPAELHILTGVGHGFGIRATNPPAIAIWPTLFYDWLGARKLLAR